MEGENNLTKILKTLSPVLNEGRYVFCHIGLEVVVPFSKALLMFRETEGITIILRKEEAEKLGLHFSYISAWITLEVHSSLSAVGLTAAFAQALGENNISCNVVAAYYHDHIFVDEKDALSAITVLQNLQAK